MAVAAENPHPASRRRPRGSTRCPTWSPAFAGRAGKPSGGLLGVLSGSAEAAVQVALLLRQIRGGRGRPPQHDRLDGREALDVSGRITVPHHEHADSYPSRSTGAAGSAVTSPTWGRSGARTPSTIPRPTPPGASGVLSGYVGYEDWWDPDAAIDGHLGNGLRGATQRSRRAARCIWHRPCHAQPVVVADSAHRHRERVPLGPTDQQGRPARRGAPAPIGTTFRF